LFPGLLSAKGLRVVQARRDLGFWYTPFKLAVLRLNRRWTRAVVANCHAVVDAVRTAEGYQSQAVHVIYNGLRSAQDDAIDIDGMRRSLGLGAEDRLVVMVANLRPLKRPQDAIGAVAAMSHDAGRRVHLALVGGDQDRSGTQMRTLQSLATELGVADRVHFVGKVPNATPWIAAADACVLCSETEGMSNAIIEYMLAAKPIVCTDVGGNPELIADGETGFVVPVGDVAAFTNRLSRLFDDEALAHRLGGAARRRALEDFTIDAMIHRHEALYASIAG
jgi:glycosyltransferase involved in cell wall biosynthesis